MMETDIILSYIKYLLEEGLLDIEYMDNIDKSKFLGSNIHKLVTSLCVNCVNLKSDINNTDLNTQLKSARNYLVHSIDSKESNKLKFFIINILKVINDLENVESYSEYNYMIY